MRDIINVVEKIVLDLREVDEGTSSRGRDKVRSVGERRQILEVEMSVLTRGLGDQ